MFLSFGVGAEVVDFCYVQGLEGGDAGGGEGGEGGGAVEDWVGGVGEVEGAEVVDGRDGDEGRGGEGGHVDCGAAWEVGGYIMVVLMGAAKNLSPFVQSLLPLHNPAFRHFHMHTFECVEQLVYYWPSIE